MLSWRQKHDSVSLLAPVARETWAQAVTLTPAELTEELFYVTDRVQVESLRHRTRWVQTVTKMPAEPGVELLTTRVPDHAREVFLRHRTPSVEVVLQPRTLAVRRVQEHIPTLVQVDVTLFLLTRQTEQRVLQPRTLAVKLKVVRTTVQVYVPRVLQVTQVQTHSTVKRVRHRQTLAV